jgi:uroporphyrinogen decarboxylase
MANTKQAIFDAFERKPTTSAPATVFGGGVWTLRHWNQQFGALIQNPRGYADIIIKTNEEVQSPIVYVGSGYNNYLAAAVGGKIKERPVGAPDLSEPVIKEHADELDALDITTIRDNPVIQNIWEATRLVAEAIGEDIIVTTTAWGPFTLAGQLFGVEDFMRATFKRKKEAHKTLDFATGLLKEFYLPLVEENVIPMASIADPTASGDLISPRTFKTYCLPYLQPLIQWFKEHGVYTWLHICGDTTDKLDLIADTGTDCFSLDYKVDVATAKEKVGHRVCLAGNVDPVSRLDQGTPETVREASLACLEAGSPGGGFILTTGCDVTPMTPIENLKAMLEAPLL